MQCGYEFYHQEYQANYQGIAITPETITLGIILLRLLCAGMKGCIKGCGEELDEISSFQGMYGLDRVEGDPNFYLYSGYIGRVNVFGSKLDRFCQVGDFSVRIKVIDAERYNFDLGSRYSIKTLVELDAMEINTKENEYHEFLKLCSLERMYERMPEKGEELERIRGLIQFLRPEHEEAAQTEYPQLFPLSGLTGGPTGSPTGSPTGGLTVEQYKELYHRFLKKMAPVDVFFNVYNYLLFLWETIGVMSINQLNTIICVVNVPQLENAFWTGSYAVFGEGGKDFYPLVSVDIVGHELSHGLVSAISNLNYQGHSGALNEAYSDIFGSLYECYINQKLENIVEAYEWLIGEDIIKNGKRTNLRNMKDPHKSYTPQPSKYNGEYYIDPTDKRDLGGVHVNSGIINHCFYLLSLEIGSAQAMRIFFQALKHCHANANFKDFSTQMKIFSQEHSESVSKCLEMVNLDFAKKATMKTRIKSLFSAAPSAATTDSRQT